MAVVKKIQHLDKFSYHEFLNASPNIIAHLCGIRRRIRLPVRRKFEITACVRSGGSSSIASGFGPNDGWSELEMDCFCESSELVAREFRSHRYCYSSTVLLQMTPTASSVRLHKADGRAVLGATVCHGAA
jgi:hypothetical protein